MNDPGDDISLDLYRIFTLRRWCIDKVTVYFYLLAPRLSLPRAAASYPSHLHLSGLVNTLDHLNKDVMTESILNRFNH